jgi:WD40 repeat protein
VTVPIEEYRKLPVLIREIKEICEKDNETYQMFCKSHDCSCCRKCTIENHKECKDVVFIEDIIQDTKTSVSCDDLQQQLSIISKNIQRIRENRQASADLIRKQKERIEKDIRYLRETINNHLDELQGKLTRELIEIEVKTNNGIQELLTTLQKKEEEIYQSQVNIENIKKYTSKLQAFLDLKQIQRISMKNETYITQSLVEDGNFKETKLSFKVEDQICNLFNNVNSFGEISIETKSSDVNIEAYKQDQAQQRVISIPVRSVNDVMFTLKQTIKTGHNNVTGCCIMSNGMMVFVKYYSEEVIVLHKDGSMGFTIDIRSGNPCHVTCIDSNNIAVSVDIDNQVHMIDLNKRSITKLINIKSEVYGIAYNDVSLVCCAEDEGLIRIYLKDNSITPVVRCSLPYWSRVTTNGTTFIMPTPQHIR